MISMKTSQGEKHDIVKKYVGKTLFFSDLIENKLNDEEVFLIQYIIDTAKLRLFTGWQESQEIDKIKVWEDIHKYNNTLSTNYQNALNRFEMKKLLVISAVTGRGKPKEMQLIEDLQDDLFDLSKVLQDKIKVVLKNNLKKELDTDLW